MTNKQPSDNAQLVKCEICLAEIPTSGAKSEEVSDYVMYFCGINCYDKWRKDYGQKGTDTVNAEKK